MASRRQQDWLTTFSDYVRQHPQIAAAIAFELGVLAAGATKRAKKMGREASAVSAKLMDAMPSMKDITAYVPGLGSSEQPRRKTRRKRRAGAAQRSNGRVTKRRNGRRTTKAA